MLVLLYKFAFTTEVVGSGDGYYPWSPPAPSGYVYACRPL